MVLEQSKEEKNLYIELQKPKLDQIVQGKHKNFSRQGHSFLEVSLFDTSLAKCRASNFIQRLFSLSASLGFHSPPLSLS